VVKGGGHIQPSHPSISPFHTLIQHFQPPPWSLLSKTKSSTTSLNFLFVRSLRILNVVLLANTKFQCVLLTFSVFTCSPFTTCQVQEIALLCFCNNPLTTGDKLGSTTGAHANKWRKPRRCSLWKLVQSQKVARNRLTSHGGEGDEGYRIKGRKKWS
jgi:hypothetical protein